MDIDDANLAVAVQRALDEAQARSRRRQQRTKIFRSTLACARSLLVRSRRWGVFDFSSVTCCLLRLVPGARPRRVSSTAKAWKLSLAIFLIRKEPRAQPSKLYRGTDTEPCIFGPNGQKAQPNGPARCLFCDTVKLNDAFLQPNSSLTVKARFARLPCSAWRTQVFDGGWRDLSVQREPWSWNQSLRWRQCAKWQRRNTNGTTEQRPMTQTSSRASTSAGRTPGARHWRGGQASNETHGILFCFFSLVFPLHFLLWLVMQCREAPVRGASAFSGRVPTGAGGGPQEVFEHVQATCRALSPRGRRRDPQHRPLAEGEAVTASRVSAIVV